MSTNYEEFRRMSDQPTVSLSEAARKPAFADGCGWCSHPSRYDGRCGTCGDERQ